MMWKYPGIYWLLVLILYIFFIRQLSIKEYKNSKIVKGSVIQKLERPSKTFVRRTYYYPQYEFIYRDSIYYNADEHFRFSRFELGEKIKIIFPKDKPSDSKIYTFATFWLNHIQLLIFPIIAFGIFILPIAGKQVHTKE